jgi:tRNA G10  N-methylase Trm11
VHASLGSSATPTQLPDGVAARLTGTYAIRFHHSGRRLSDVDRGSITSAVWRAHTAPRVDLDRPDVDLHVYVGDDRLWFGELIGDCAPELRDKQPRRPFTRSYEMRSRRARVLVNLSGARPQQRFVDPFCGTGAVVIEASRIGCVAIGFDVDKQAAAGAARNAAFDRAGASWLAADARAVPFAESSLHAVAADLPYGRSAGRRGVTGADLYRSTLAALRPAVAHGARAALMALEADAPQQSTDGWQLSWSCVEQSRTVTRAIGIWHAI